MQITVRVSKAENELSPIGQNCRSRILLEMFMYLSKVESECTCMRSSSAGLQCLLNAGQRLDFAGHEGLQWSNYHASSC